MKEPTQRLSNTEVIPYALWVCSVSAQGKSAAIIVTWVTQISFSPLLIGVALENESEFLKTVTATGEFTLSLLPRDGGKDIAKRILKAGMMPDNPAYAGTTPVQSGWSGVPGGAMGALRCKVHSSEEVGDHTLIVGAVTEEVRWIDGSPLHLSDTGWKYTRPGSETPPSQTKG